MKVILLKDVPKVGRKYEVKEVSSGFASNHLFPNKLAQPATPKEEARIASLREKANAEREQKEGSLRELITSLDGTSVELSAKADGTGHLFKKLRAKDIADKLSDVKGVGIDEDMVDLESPIGEVGTHEVAIQKNNSRATVTVSVVKV